MNPLAQQLVEAGLLQFGSFHVNGVESPVQTHLEMLPSYPDVLRAIVQAMAPLVPRDDHLLATADAVPLGVALSLEAGVPLVYSRGTGEAAVFDLVGAYDIGHPASLVTNVLLDEDSTLKLAKKAESVGLEVGRVLCVLNLRVRPFSATALLSLEDLLDDFVREGMLPERESRAVRAWLRRGSRICE
jgi:orotate phosphoribosyltransferase